MKKYLLLCLMILAALSCSSNKKTLHVYIWSDYVKEELITAFEKKYDCKVVLDFYDSNETMYAKLKAGTTGYDVAFPSGYMISIMADQGMLVKLDHSKIPNLKNIDPKYLQFSLDSKMEYSVMYMISNSGIGYLGSKVDAEKAASWKIFGEPEFKGRMTMLNDYRETIGAALKTLGYSLNTVNQKELEEARDLLIEWKKNLAKFEADQYKNGLVSGEFTVVHGYNGDIMQVMEENDDIVYVLPAEGTTIASDNMVILNKARQPELAHDFINFLLDAKVAAENTEYVWFLAPNIASYEFLSEEIKGEESIFLPDDTLAKCEVIEDLGENNALYSAIWDAVKAAP